MIASIVTVKKCIVMFLCVIVSSNEKCNTWIVNYKLRSDTCLLVYVIYLFSWGVAKEGGQPQTGAYKGVLRRTGAYRGVQGRISANRGKQHHVE